MKCDRSTKRNLLVNWGMRVLHGGDMSLDEVQAEINRMMKRPISEIREFIKC